MQDSFIKFIDDIAKLRGENGCPWDKKQTLYSLVEDFIEESYELRYAIKNKDIENIKEELGDILLHVALHSQIASEEGLFDINDVIRGIHEKLIRRHPHVYGDESLATSEEVMVKWEEIKKIERGNLANEKVYHLSKIHKALPASIKAHKLQERAAKVGFDWRFSQDVLLKAKEEFEELIKAFEIRDENNIKEELGDLLFVLSNLARKCGYTAEEALEGANNKFISRFNYIEDKLDEQGKNFDDVTLDEMDAYWTEAKTKEKQLS